LNTFDDWADIYDAVYLWKTDDIAFYLQEAKNSGGPVLELGCGTGRISIPIGDSGLDIYGIDSSEAMIEMARSKTARLGRTLNNIHWIRSDMTDFAIDVKFALVIIPFRGFMSLLTIADQRNCLARIREHLLPGGKLIFDIFFPDVDLLNDSEDTLFHYGDIYDSEGNSKLVIWHQNRFDNFNQINNERSVIENVDASGFVNWRRYMDFQVRYSHRFEIQYLLELTGFKICDLYGDFDWTYFDETSEEMIWIVEPLESYSRHT
tara:strand:+ start:7750 stop:8538 length:789 start_codon:yes stop_codon:yes gene_type:complete